MKNNESKSTTSRNQQAKSQDPFFSKGREHSFFSEKDNENPFFTKRIQPQLNIGSPDGNYEKEADRIADKVVNQADQHSGEQSPLASSITPFVQRSEEEIQEKPAFESPSVLDVESPSYDGLAFDTILGKAEGNALQLNTTAPPPSQNGRSLEEELAASKGKGEPMEPNVQNKMESAFGNDFSDVRIHNDSNAVQMNRGLGSHAFTQGNDIYFNQGQYQPGTKSGDHLLAHELTHTVQQGGVQRKMVQRQGGTGQSATNPNVYKYKNKDDHKIDLTPNNRKLYLPEIKIPKFKKRNAAKFNAAKGADGLKRPKNHKRGSTNQREGWKKAVKPKVETAFNSKFAQLKPLTSNDLSGKTYFLKSIKKGSNFFVFGTKEEIIQTSLIPTWNNKGEPNAHEVDHIVEMQMGGQDIPDNYELLDAQANNSSGGTIAGKIRSTINDGLTKLRNEHKGVKMAHNVGTAKKYYDIFFKDVKFTEGLKSGEPNRYWSYGGADFNILNGDHFNQLKEADDKDLQQLLGSDNEIKVFVTGKSGIPRPIKIPKNAADPNDFEVNVTNWFPNYDLTHVKLGTNPEITGTAFSRKKEKGAKVPLKLNAGIIPLKLAPLDNLRNTYIVPPDLKNAIPGGFHRKLSIEGLSPIQVNTALLTEQGFYLEGKILPTVPVIKDANIDLIVQNGELRIRKIFETGEFNLPGPFQITDSSLEIFAGTEGFGIEGAVDLEISKLGKGSITASISTEGGFALKGSFAFDTTLFDPAEVNVEYVDEVLTIGGTLGIPKGKVKGIKKATITVSYSEGNISASGDADLDIPGVEKGAMEVTYGDDQFSIGGDFKLSGDIPGIKGGSVGVKVTKDEEGNYSVHAKGTAQPDIPGIDSELSVDYLDGALTIKGNAAYKRGLLSGKVDVTATNRVIDEDGQPTDQIAKKFSVYGGGELTLQITPWLAATAGVRFLPNGEIEVKGRIELPDTVDVFPRKSFNRNLFRMPTIEIPIFAIPLGPRSLGLVATINGGLDFNAGIGPGQIRDLYGEVTYNPAHPEQTKVSAGGKFVIPADAGLTLRADLGLGLSVGIASLTGGIEVAGTLGLEGEAAAEVKVDWTPNTGFEIKAKGSVMINPKFTFDINLLARAKLDLWLVSFSKEWRHNLYSFSWGPDIKFGLIFPIHYIEGQPFDVSFDDIEVIYPELDIGDIAMGLGKKIKNDVF